MSSETTDRLSSATTPQSNLTWYEQEALKYAEEIGVIEYKVNGNLMEYWSFFGSEGWFFIRYDLDKKKEIFRGANIPFDEDISTPIPAFLRTERGSVLYNYFEG